MRLIGFAGTVRPFNQKKRVPPIAAALLCVAALIATAQSPRVPSPKPLIHADPSDYTYGQGYVEAGANGGAYAFGNANFEGSTESIDNGITAQQWFGAPIVGVAALPGNNGYFMVANSPGGDDIVTCGFGNAQAYYYQHGSAANWCFESYPGVDDAVGVAVDNANNGYWMVGSDGGIFAFDNAPYDGSAHGILPSGQSVVAMAATPDGYGYWEVTNGGYIYAYGDAQYEGGVNGLGIACAIVGMAAAENDSSYWLDGCDGGLYSIGQAPFDGALAQTAKYFNIQAIASTPDGYGYYLMAFDGSILTYGDAQYQGDVYGNNLYGYGQIAGVAGTS